MATTAGTATVGMTKLHSTLSMQLANDTMTASNRPTELALVTPL
jgi:hypothetical protein